MNPVNGSNVLIGNCHCGDPIVELAGVATSEDGKTVTLTTVTLLFGHNAVGYAAGEFAEQEGGGVDMTIREVTLVEGEPNEDHQAKQSYPELPESVTAFLDRFVSNQNEGQEQDLPKIPDTIKQLLAKFDNTDELPKIPDVVKQLLAKFDNAKDTQESALASNEG